MMVELRNFMLVADLLRSSPSRLQF